MKNLMLLILSFILFIGCQQDQTYQPSSLVKVSEEQLIQNAKNYELPNPEALIYKNINGKTLSLDSLRNIEDPESLAADYYQNTEGVMVEAIIRKATKKDKELIKKIEAAFKEGPDVNTVEVNCEDKKQLLKGVYEKDQGMRKGKRPFDPKVDHANLETIISFIEKCGMPRLEEVSREGMDAIWLVLQHAPAKYQSKYIPILEESAKLGDIDKGSIALMKDRALMNEGKPQIYGSQFVGNELYDLYEPAYVNQRRAELGMEPIEEYLKKVGIEFNVEQKNK